MKPGTLVEIKRQTDSYRFEPNETSAYIMKYRLDMGDMVMVLSEFTRMNQLGLRPMFYECYRIWNLTTNVILWVYVSEFTGDAIQVCNFP